MIKRILLCLPVMLLLNMTHIFAVLPEPLVLYPQDDLFISQGTNSTVNYNDTENIGIQRQGTNNREVWFRFNLSSLEIPEGYMIDKAVISAYCYANNRYDANVPAAFDMNLYKIPSNYTAAEVTWSAVFGTGGWSRDSGDIVAATEMPVTEKYPNKYFDFDITEYIKGLDSFGLEAFAVFPSTSSSPAKATNFYSMEKENGAYTPKLTVTFKPIEVSMELCTFYDSDRLELQAMEQGTITAQIDITNYLAEGVSVAAVAVVTDASVCRDVIIMPAPGGVTVSGGDATIEFPFEAYSTESKIQIFLADISAGNIRPLSGELIAFSDGGFNRVRKD